MRWVALFLLITACGKPVATCPDPPQVCVITPPMMGCMYQYAACCSGAYVCPQGELSTFPGSCPIDQTNNFASCP